MNRMVPLRKLGLVVALALAFIVGMLLQPPNVARAAASATSLVFTYDTGAMGQAVMASSLPVTIASNQGAITTQLPTSLGAKTTANSTAVTIASDQGAITTQLPTTLGAKTTANSMAVNLASDQGTLAAPVIVGISNTTNAITYRVAFSVAAPVGDFVELRGVAGKKARITKIFIAKPLAQFKLSLTKRSALDTVGTSTTPTPLPYDSGDAAATSVVKVYTVAPTQGAAVADAVTLVPIATTDYAVFTFGDSVGKSFVLNTNESFALVSDTATTIPGYVEWTEATN